MSTERLEAAEKSFSFQQIKEKVGVYAQQEGTKDSHRIVDLKEADLGEDPEAMLALLRTVYRSVTQQDDGSYRLLATPR